jgi:uncharacterized membrane protein (DUF485 family)
MAQDAHEKISLDLNFQKLVRDRTTFSWILTAVMLVSYYTFILVIAFSPHWLGLPISTGSIITWGIPVGILLIILSMVITGVYVLRCNREYDERMSEIISRLNV